MNFHPCGCETDGRNWLSECDYHHSVRRQRDAGYELAKWIAGTKECDARDLHDMRQQARQIISMTTKR